MQQTQCLLDPLGHLLVAKPLIARAIGHIFCHGLREQLAFWMLHDIADRAAQRLELATVGISHMPAVSTGHGNAGHGDITRRRLAQRAYQLCQRGFARAVRAHQRHGFAGVDMQRHVRKHRTDGIRIGEGHVVERDEGSGWLLRCLFGCG